ncbi:hypothetical protein Clacol_006360 [Clathrus columnatus]|uniref:tRNA (guanine(26)-N(2))-dimethyltransferase n=1 Tax=Clathrus columnatus TaxID=1419009 RepID=A0AAV5ABW3_9AGAM|nr:hypothetical protein Clacol_006360 [Clathrus columnatus]
MPVKQQSAPSSNLALAFNPNPIPPPSEDEHGWLTTYLIIHRLSSPSYRYSYLLWIAVVLVFLLSIAFHWNGRICGSYVNGLWKKWGYRRRTWRKKHSLAEARRKNKPHKQPMPLPSNAQLLGLLVLLIITLALSFIGPDYIAPGTHIWDLAHNTTQPTTTNSPSFSAAPPSFTISKTWWSSGDRTGAIAFALFPLCVLFALKAPPFAIFSVPFFVQLYNDKLAFLHRWSGRLIWLITTLHVAFWTVQLYRDSILSGTPLFTLAFTYEKFVFGWLGFICLTLVMAMSLRPVRVEVYEAFYILHLVLVPGTLVFSALHFPPIAWWCWATLILWGCERAWRFVRFIIINGLLGRLQGRRSDRYIRNIHAGAMEKARRLRSSNEFHSPTGPTTIPANNWPATDPKRLSIGQVSIQSFQTGSSAALLSSSHARSASPTPIHPNYPSQLRLAGYSSRGAYVPPPGYAHATLLPGRTIRLRLIPPHHFSWAPGQHVLLTIPSVSKFGAHPFTISSVCDGEAVTDDGRELLILIRARTGFTKDLWMHVERLEEAGALGDEPDFNFVRPSRGVLLRTYVDGPFGSSTRAKWTAYDTVLIIAGGSGISFAASILEYSCMCLMGRDGKSLGGNTGSWGNGAISQIKRVRLVWVIREFTHIQWASATIRRCLELVSSPSLQIDIFVTNAPDPKTPTLLSPVVDDPLPRLPSIPAWNDKELNHSQNSLGGGASTHSLDVENNEVTDILNMYGALGHEQHELDLTNFDGEDDTQLPGERYLSRRLREEGRFRREQSRLSGLPPFSRDSIHQKRMSGFISTGRHPVLDAPSSKLWQSSVAPDSAPSIVIPEGAYVPNRTPVSPTSANSTNILQASPVDNHSFFKPRARDPRRDTRFDMDEIEVEDVPLVSELARPGRASVDQIITEEASRSYKSLIVACCGPTTLNAVVRKSVAKQIKPLSIMRGQTPAIELVSEDFEWVIQRRMSTSALVPDGFLVHTENGARLLLSQGNDAFLNPVQEFNRDLSVAAITVWSELLNEIKQKRWENKQKRKASNLDHPDPKRSKSSVSKTDEVKSINLSVEETNEDKSHKYRPYQFVVLEPLSATGLRAIRYAQEIPNVKYVIANDLSPSAIEVMKRNVLFNNLCPEEPFGENEQERPGKVRVNEGDACLNSALMYSHRSDRQRVDVVDLDPYGTAAPFIDAAVQCVTDGDELFVIIGLICVTCTDLSVLGNTNYPEKCFANYGGVPVKAEFCHEAALRLVLNTLSTSAARYGRYIQPLLSLSIDFYVRMFVRVQSAPIEVKKAFSQTSLYYVCTNCQAYYQQTLGKVVDKSTEMSSNPNLQYKVNAGPPVSPMCGECGGTFHIAGPMWSGPLHDKDFTTKLLQHIDENSKRYGTTPRMKGMVSLAHDVCAQLVGVLISALLNSGYEVSRSHACAGSIKTTASRKFIYDVYRAYVKAHPVKTENIKEGSPAAALLAKKAPPEVDFSYNCKAGNLTRVKLVRYQQNPTSHWGPGTKAGKRKRDEN